MSDSSFVILVGAVIGLILTYVIIRIAVQAATQDIHDELIVNNSLLRRQQGIKVNSVEEVRREYENGAYTLEHATNLKAKFKKEGKL